jgi:hypothetical protein
MKLAAAEIERVGVVGELLAKGGGEGVDALLALFFYFDQSRLFEDAEVLGDVVGRYMTWSASHSSVTGFAPAMS